MLFRGGVFVLVMVGDDVVECVGVIFEFGDVLDQVCWDYFYVFWWLDFYWLYVGIGWGGDQGVLVQYLQFVEYCLQYLFLFFVQWDLDFVYFYCVIVEDDDVWCWWVMYGYYVFVDGNFGFVVFGVVVVVIFVIVDQVQVEQGGQQQE